MKQYWLGVVSSADVVRRFEEECWWCLPFNARIGDPILMYCTRAASSSEQGVFAHCEVAMKPSEDHEQNFCCGGYGNGPSGGGSLYYVKLKLNERFEHRLTAHAMKNDRTLKAMSFVRKNFQATTFPLPKEAYERILRLTPKRPAR